MIDWDKVSESPEVIYLIKKIEIISKKVISLDEMALVRYQLELLNQEDEEKNNI